MSDKSSGKEDKGATRRRGRKSEIKAAASSSRVEVKAGASGAKKEEIATAKIDWRANLDKLLGTGVRVFTDAEVSYKKGGPLYLIIAGHVIDVTSGEKMYGGEGGYNGFIGRDGTLAFFTGQFDEAGLTSDLGEIKADLAQAISTWINFYLNHETYKFVGYHQGRFFDADGMPLKQIYDLKKELGIAEVLAEIETKLEQQFPTCNVEWTAETGSKLWCSKSSGGVERSWTGVPRMFEDKTKKGSRCACVKPEDLNDPRVKEYKECDKRSIECRLKD